MDKPTLPFDNPFGKEGYFGRLWQRSAGIRRYIALDRSVNQLVAKGMDPRAIQTSIDLFRHWGDPLDQSREAFLRSCLTEFQETKGSILLAGASALTLVLGAVGNAGETKRNVWCFDQDPHWSHVIRTWLQRYNIKNTFMISAAPAVVQNLVRYRIDTKRLPKDFGLVLCEGSRGTPRNALSTLHHFGDHLAPTFTLLARRVNVDEDGPLLMQWASDHGATFVIINKKEGYIKVARRAMKKGKDADKAAAKDAPKEAEKKADKKKVAEGS